MCVGKIFVGVVVLGEAVGFGGGQNPSSIALKVLSINRKGNRKNLTISKINQTNNPRGGLEQNTFVSIFVSKCTNSEGETFKNLSNSDGIGMSFILH